MLKLVNSIDREAVRVPVLITLTYPRTWPSDPKVWKDQLKAFRKRLERRYGRFAALWRLEFQKRGAPHFHLLCFFDRDWTGIGGPEALGRLMCETSDWWYEVCGKICRDHLVAGTRVELPRSWRGVNAYLAKYMGKLETLAPGVRPGRLWGVWRKELLPISYEVVEVGFRDAVRARRMLRRLSRRKCGGDLRRFDVFALHGTTRRMLSWLGYYRN